MKDNKRIIYKFLDRYLKDLDWYAVVDINGCVDNIQVYKNGGRLISYSMYDSYNQINHIVLSHQLFSTMIEALGLENEVDAREPYSIYMENMIKPIISSYVNDNSTCSRINLENNNALRPGVKYEVSISSIPNITKEQGLYLADDTEYMTVDNFK